MKRFLFLKKFPNLLPDDAPVAHFIIPDELIILIISATMFVIAISLFDKGRKFSD